MNEWGATDSTTVAEACKELSGQRKQQQSVKRERPLSKGDVNMSGRSLKSETIAIEQS